MAILNGTNAYLSYDSNTSRATAYTAMVWVRFDAVNAWQAIISLYADGSNYDTLEANDSDRWDPYRDGQGQYIGSPQPAINTWYHVALVGTSTQLLFYLDGTLTATISRSQGGGTPDIFFGAWGPASDLLDGKLTYARMWVGTALSAAQIAAERTKDTAQLTTNLYGDWKLTANTTDSSGNGRNLTAIGTVTYDSDVPSAVEQSTTNVDKTASDTSALTESATLAQSASLNGTDSGTLADTGAVAQAASQTASDSATATDSSLLAVAGSATEGATLSESVQLNRTSQAVDSATFTDTGIVSLSQAITASDSAALSDSAQNQPVLTAIDSATSTDSSQLSGVASLTASDSATVSDSGTVGTALPPSNVLETFEDVTGNWLVNIQGSVTRSSTEVRSGSYSARMASTGSPAYVYDASFSSVAGTWEEYPGRYNWQRAFVYVPSTTVANLGATEYIDIAGYWPTGAANEGWWLRIRQNGTIYLTGYDANGNSKQQTLYDTFPTDEWVEVQIGLHTQNGPGVKRAVAFLINGQGYGWFIQGRNNTTWNRSAFGIVRTNSSDSNIVYVDDWCEATTVLLPVGTDNRPSGPFYRKDFTDQSGANWAIDWSTWGDLVLDGTAGLYSAGNRLQSGFNQDRLPDLSEGWWEIELDWPNGTPPLQPDSAVSYGEPMAGMRKDKNTETNLEVYVWGNGGGDVLLQLEAWVGSPIQLATWQLPLGTANPTSRIPEPGDIIRCRWIDSSATNIRVWVSYYDASTDTWYDDIIDHDFNATNISGVNYKDGRHTASSITIDSPAYSIRQFTSGDYDSYPSGDIQSTDSGTLSDSSQLAQSIALTGSDTTTLTDSSSAAAAIPANDTGTLNETASLNQTHQASDTGALTEAISTSAAVQAEETATLSESVSLAEARTLTATDSASATEAATLTGGSDYNASDSAGLAEAVQLSVGIEPEDAAILSENVTLGLALTSTDDLTLADTSASTLTLVAQDSASLDEQSTRTGGNTYNGNETIALSETASLQIVTIASDQGVIDESVAITLEATDAGTASEVTSLNAAPSGQDSASLSEAGSRNAGSNPAALDSFALVEGATLSIESASSDSASLTESQVRWQDQSASDSANLSETSTLTQTITLQAQDSGTLTESSSIVVTLASADSAAGVDVPVAAASLTDTEAGTLAESADLLSGIYHIGNDGFWLTESTLLQATFQTVDSGLLAEAIADRTLTSAEIYNLTDITYGVGEGELPDRVIPGTFYHMLLSAYWQENHGEVFKWRDTFWYVIRDNEQIIFKQLPFEADLNHPNWGKYRGPIGLIKDEA